MRNKNRIVISIILYLLLYTIGFSGDPLFPVAQFGQKKVDNSSPLVADFRPDYAGKEIVVASLGGGIFMFDCTGAQIWNVDPSIAIDSSPTAADIDGDGYLDIVIGLGSIDETRDPSQYLPGGIMVLDGNGNTIWSFRGTAISPAGVFGSASLPFTLPESLNEVVNDNKAEYVEATAAVADVDGDDKPEIFFGALDHNFYALNHDGTLLDFNVNDDNDSKVNEDPGWIRVNSGNIDDDGDGSKNCNTTTGKCIDEDPPDWPIDNQDTIFSSAALGDINGDGEYDLVFGGDSTAGIASYCPGGGKLWFLNYRGVSGRPGGYPLPIGSQLMPSGNVLCKGQIFASSPAIADVNGDGKLEIFIGNGNYSPYYSSSDTRCLFGFDFSGNNLPGFPYMCPNGHMIRSSPALGDINGDGVLEVVFCSGNYAGSSSMIHAVNTQTGASLAGFPVTPSTNFSQQIASPVLADINSDGKPDIIVPFLNHVFGFDYSGNQLLDQFLNGADAFQNSVVADDIDYDGKIEIVAAGPSPYYATGNIGGLFIFEQGNFNAGAQHWPMFRNNINRTGQFRYPSNWAAAEGWDSQNNWDCYGGASPAPSSIASYNTGRIECYWPSSTLPSPGFFQWFKWNSGHTGVEYSIPYSTNSLYITDAIMRTDSNNTVPQIRLRAQAEDNKWVCCGLYGGDPNAGEGGVPTTNMQDFYLVWEPQGSTQPAFLTFDIFSSTPNTGTIYVEQFITYRVNMPMDYQQEKLITDFSSGWTTLPGTPNVTIGSNITIADTSTWSIVGALLTCNQAMTPSKIYRLKYYIQKSGGNATDSIRLRASDAGNGAYNTNLVLTQDIPTAPQEFSHYHVGMNSREPALGDIGAFIDTIHTTNSASSITLSKLIIESFNMPGLN